MKHIYWFSHYNPQGPCVRYRGIYLLNELYRSSGISHDFVYPGYHPAVLFRFFRIWLGALLFRKKDSVIVFQKIHTKSIYSSLLKILLYFRSTGTVYDIDDAYHLKGYPENIFYFVKNCATVFCGSKELINDFKKLNNNIHLLSSPVIEHNYLKKYKNTVLNIGWIGFFNAHRDCLTELVFPALKRITFPARITFLGVRWENDKRFIREYFRENENLEIDIPENINWVNENEVYERIAEFDLGLSPLLDTSFFRAKSAFKLKQYLSCGVPVLASPVGENIDFLDDGKNGFICGNSEAFFLGIQEIRLMSDEKYQQFSEQGRRTFSRFSMSGFAFEYVTLLEKLFFSAETRRVHFPETVKSGRIKALGK